MKDRISKTNINPLRCPSRVYLKMHIHAKKNDQKKNVGMLFYILNKNLSDINKFIARQTDIN